MHFLLLEKGLSIPINASAESRLHTVHLQRMY